MKQTILARCLPILFACLGLASLRAAEPASVIPATVLKTNSLSQLLSPPSAPGDFPAWLAGMKAYREEMQPVLLRARGELADPYAQPELQWAQRSFIQPQMMAHERFFFDPIKRRYTVKRYLKDLNDRYGGIDSVLIWPTYPNIGVDNRNQFDLWRGMPGGLKGLKRMVDDFHAHGVRVLLPIMYWDHGTRDEGKPMEQSLAELARDIGADGLNGDTMSPIGREFYDAAMRVKHPLALEPEVGLGTNVEALAWNVMSWGYWWPYQPAPGVDRYKFIEPRHLTHVCDRWAHDRTDMLQYAFFNGDGYESWETIWGIWNGFTPRDAEALRRISAVYRALPSLLISPNYEPHTPTLQPGVFATRFPGAGQTLWTLINRTAQPVSGKVLQIQRSSKTRVFDLWRGIELFPSDSSLALDLEPRGYGAVLAVEGRPDARVRALLAAHRSRGHIRLADLSATWRELPQKLVEIAPTAPAAQAPAGMIRIPGGKFLFEVEGVMIERSEGVDVQYPWEDKPQLKHRHELEIKPFYIDRCPVTCAEFKRFLDATHYHPVDDHNFLRDWQQGQYPAGWERKPVTWVSIEDARAYAKWAGKRLPHEWEWQYAAQGTDGRKYPWGNEADPKLVPPLETTRQPGPAADVDAHPQAASPFGVLDLVGNVWQWTDEYQDEHTRAAILRGGSHYRPSASYWYFPQARELREHGKYLLMAPSLDRSACIGFRCVAEAN